MSTNKAVDSCLELSELSLDEAALGESGTEESGVDGDQDPGTFAEGNGGEQETAPEEDFKDGNETH